MVVVCAQVNAGLDDGVDIDRGAKLHQTDAGRLVVPLDHPLDVLDEALGRVEAVLRAVHIVGADAVQGLEERDHVGGLPAQDGDAGNEAARALAPDLEGDRAVHGRLVARVSALSAVPPASGPTLEEGDVVVVKLGAVAAFLAGVSCDNLHARARGAINAPDELLRLGDDVNPRLADPPLEIPQLPGWRLARCAS